VLSEARGGGEEEGEMEEGVQGRLKRARAGRGKGKIIPPANSTCVIEILYQSSGQFFIKCNSENFSKKFRTSSVDFHEEYFFGGGSPRALDFLHRYSRWEARIISRFS
jgi:hypothetical protein